jgi:Protein of unknown function (DUF2934)
MDERKSAPRIRKRSVMSTSRPPLFDPLRFVEPKTLSKSRVAAKARDSNPEVDAGGLKSRSALIAELAYFRAMDRGFQPGHELDDWLAAEVEVDKRARPGNEH